MAGETASKGKGHRLIGTNGEQNDCIDVRLRHWPLHRAEAQGLEGVTCSSSLVLSATVGRWTGKRLVLLLGLVSSNWQ